jgi:raffinose/stachyose/melibiose transport system substrate-binding protein
MKKLLVVLLVLALAGQVFAGGSNQSGGSQGGKTTLRLVTWTNPASVEAIKAVSAKFTAQNPNIVVEITDVESRQTDSLIRTRMAANDVDITSHQGLRGEQVDWAPGAKPLWQEMVDAGNYLDITNEPWIGAWGSGADGCTYNNKVYGVVVGNTIVTGIFYNKKLFADNGWQVPKTWAEFERLCAAIKAKGIAPMTVGAADGWPYTAVVMDEIVSSVEPDHAGLARALWTGERKFTDAQSLEIYRRGEFFNNNFEANFMAIPYSAAPGRFVAGRAAMMPDGNWNVTEVLAADPNFQVGYFPCPGTTAGIQFQVKPDLSFHINAKSPNKDAAVKWLAFLSEKANYSEFINTIGFIPSMPGVSVSNKFLSEEILPYVTQGMPLWEINYRAPTGVGQYAGYAAFQYLKSAGGPVDTIQELARLAQKDWDDGKAAVGK